LYEGDEVKVFLLAKGVEAESLDSDKFKITDQMEEFCSGQLVADEWPHPRLKRASTLGLRPRLPDPALEGLS